MTKGASSGLSNALLAVLLLGFGLSFGLNYGTSNQAVYLLDSVRALHPNTWAHDWFVSQTHVYHPAYAALGAVLLRLSPSGYGIGFANVVCIALGMLAVYELIKRLAPPQEALPALLIVLLLASVTRTQAPGGTYAFSEIFQPSTLGSLGLIAAGLFFVSGRPLASGLCLAFAGVFHVNYLVLGLCVFGVAWLLSGRERLVPRALAGLGPALLVLVYFLPFLLVSATPGVSAEARRIYIEVRSPHHYCVPLFAWDFSFWIGFQLLGLAALFDQARLGVVFARRVLVLMIGTWVLVIPAALLSSVVVVRLVQQLMAWRVCPQANLLAHAGLATALVSVLRQGRTAARTFGRPARWLACAGIFALALGSIVTGHWNATLVVLCLLLVATLVALGLPALIGRLLPDGLSPRLLAAILLLTLLGANVWRFAHLGRTSSLLSGADRGVGELCSWAREHTSEDALFLTPPQEEELRFRCGRAIVVDWKAEPAVPTELLEWYGRLEQVTGRIPFNREADTDGYQSLDAARVGELRARYGFDYVVVERGHELDLGVAPAFTGQRLVAYALPRRAL